MSASKEYTNGEITILWQAEKCTHSGICVKTLPTVYDPKDRPWIKMENATSEELMAQVAKCPSGALSIKKETDTVRIHQEDNGKKGRFVISENGIFAGEMTYTWAGDGKIIIDHTGVEDDFGGKGFGKKLVLQAVEFAREKGIKILPLCPFAKAAFDRDASIQDVRF